MRLHGRRLEWTASVCSSHLCVGELSLLLILQGSMRINDLRTQC